MCGHKVCVKTDAATKFSVPVVGVYSTVLACLPIAKMFVLSFVKIGRLVQKMEDLKRLLFAYLGRTAG
jgi:hypothetical protein